MEVEIVNQILSLAIFVQNSKLEKLLYLVTTDALHQASSMLKGVEKHVNFLK